MVQIVEMTHDEKVAMYMKQPKKKLVEMLIQSNLHLEHYTKQLQIHNVSGSDFSSSSVTLKKEGYYTDNYRTYYMDADGKKHYR
jgi:hypothetical protein